MTQGFYAGISGLQTNQYGLDVISDNLANLDTTAYKSSNYEFSDLFSKVIGSGTVTSPTSNDIGYGTKLQATSFDFHQGTISASDRFNDVALEGNGWFKVSAPNNQEYFTRDGHFTYDTYQKANGDVNSSMSRLVTADGYYVTGTMLGNLAYNAGFDYGDTASNNTPGAFVLTNATNEAPLADVNSQTTLELPTRLAYPVEPTTTVSFTGNLGVADSDRSISANVISGTNQINRLTLSFSLSATQPAEGVAWDVKATVTSKDGSTVYDSQTGQAIFGASGAITSFNIGSVNNDGTTVSLDLGSGFGGIVAIDGVPTSGASQSNGVSGGTLTDYGINANGVIVANFSNGRQSAIGRLAVYHFQNDQGLNREGGTYFTQSADSGKPMFWTDANGNAVTGAIVRSGYLEGSNADISVGLTDMIITQRAYQANAKTVTTVDEMIQKALQMHR